LLEPWSSQVVLIHIHRVPSLPITLPVLLLLLGEALAVFLDAELESFLEGELLDLIVLQAVFLGVQRQGVVRSLILRAERILRVVLNPIVLPVRVLNEVWVLKGGEVHVVFGLSGPFLPFDPSD